MRDLDILFAQNWVEQFREDFWKSNKNAVTRTHYAEYTLPALIMFGLGWDATPEREILWSGRYDKTCYPKPFFR